MSCSAPETPGFLEELSDGHRYGPSPGLVPRTQGNIPVAKRLLPMGVWVLTGVYNHGTV